RRRISRNGRRRRLDAHVVRARRATADADAAPAPGETAVGGALGDGQVEAARLEPLELGAALRGDPPVEELRNALLQARILEDSAVEQESGGMDEARARFPGRSARAAQEGCQVPGDSRVLRI